MQLKRPADGICAARGTILHNLSLVNHKQLAMPCYTRHGELMEQSLRLRPIPSEDFFFFGECYDFGTKIGISSRLRPASSNNFEKWPTRVQTLCNPDV